jgi:outer membrane protein assembly factor BamB
MIRRLLSCAICVAVAVVTTVSLAIDTKPTVKRDKHPWPQWRGPNRDGISPDKGLLKQWPKEGPPLAWKAEGLGAGFAGISIAEGRIYSMGDIDGKQCVFALDSDDGSMLWKTPIGGPWDPGGYSGPRCTPAYDNGLLYAVGTSGDLVCVQASDGKEVWRKSFPKDFGGKMHSMWGFSESPLVDGDRVICTPGGPDAALAALDKKTGSVIWQTKIPNLGDKGKDGAAYASVVISNGAGVKQYVQFIGRGVVGVAADDGRFLWGYNKIANGVANIPTPLVQDDYIFCSSGYGTGAALLKLNSASGGVEAEEVYFLDAKKLQNHHGGMVMVGDYVYCGHGHKMGAPTCLEWKTGDIKWRKERGPGEASAAVGYADGNLYFRYENGLVALIGATPEAYELKGTFKIPGVDKPSWPHPVIVGGKLYLREQNRLYCYNVSAK